MTNWNKTLWNWKVMVMVVIGVAGLAGCNAPAPLPATIDQHAIFTQAAQTLIAGLTQAAPAATLPPTTPVEASTSFPYPMATDTPPAPTDTPAPSATPLLAATPSPTVLFEDDFSRQSWYVESTDFYEFEYVEGRYRIAVKTTSSGYWSVRTQNLQDAILQVDAERESGDADGYFGLVCRHVDGDNYYALVIGNEGFYGIASMLDGEFEFLEEGLDTSGAIRKDETNRIQADCIGERLILYVNGQKLLEVQDDSMGEGEAGVIAGTRSGDEFSALFDQFVIYQP
jgi:hypothetical protein